MPNAAEYAKRKLTGLCGMCGSRPAATGLTKCEVCREVQVKFAEAAYIERQLNGLCGSCGRPAVVGLLICDVHRSANKRNNRAHIDRIEARIGTRHSLPEWRIRECEREQQRVREIREVINAR